MANSNIQFVPGFYENLGVEHDATEADIENAYNQIINFLNSQQLPENPALQQYKEDIDTAYQVLHNSELRSQYDEYLQTLTYVENDSNANEEQLIPVESVEEDDDSYEISDRAKSVLKGIGIGLLVILVLLGSAIGISKIIKMASKNKKDLDTDVDEESISNSLDEFKDDQASQYEFYDTNNQEQIKKRAQKIHDIFSQAGIDYPTDKIETHIDFINGNLYLGDNEDPYDVLNDYLEYIGKFSSNMADATNFAGGVITNNTVNVSDTFRLFLPDNSPNASVINDFNNLYIQLVNSKDRSEMESIAKEMLTKEGSLMIGSYKTSSGEITYGELTENETFVLGNLLQTAAHTVKASLGDKYKILLSDPTGQDDYVSIDIDTIQEFYNPKCDDGVNLDLDSEYGRSLTDLIRMVDAHKGITKVR